LVFVVAYPWGWGTYRPAVVTARNNQHRMPRREERQLHWCVVCPRVGILFWGVQFSVTREASRITRCVDALGSVPAWAHKGRASTLVQTDKEIAQITHWSLSLFLLHKLLIFYIFCRKH
jgi:hypothetical protein